VVLSPFWVQHDDFVVGQRARRGEGASERL
jgi:hypothetical protein